MSKFTKTVRRTFEFEDDEVVVVLRRLKRKDMMKLMPYMKGVEDGESIGTMDSIQMLDFSADMLIDYVVSMTGLIDGDGDEMNFSDIAGEAYFMNLISEICMALFEVSNMSKDDSKNSPRQSTTSASTPEQDVDIPSHSLHVKVGLESSSDAAGKNSGAGQTEKATLSKVQSSLKSSM